MKCEGCEYFGRPSDAPETVEMECMWMPSEGDEDRPCGSGVGMTEEIMKDITQDFLGKFKGLCEWLEEIGFFHAPAARSHHGAEWGGLFMHSLQVVYELQNLSKRLDLKWQRPESPVIIGMLHDICKVDNYSILPFGDEPGKPGIEWNKDATYPGHGEKSLIMLMGHIDLTEEEKACIRYHMGAFVDQKEWSYYSRAVKNWPNVLYVHTADMIASQIKGV